MLIFLIALMAGGGALLISGLVKSGTPYAVGAGFLLVVLACGFLTMHILLIGVMP